MVKLQGAAAASAASPKRPTSLRVDMKRKLTLPAPFVVSRGYTPEYPWLGQEHPEPKKKPRLLMQQSPASFLKCVLCVACFILGLALIAFAGSTILRGQSARRALESRLPPRTAPAPAPAPVAAALVRQDPEAAPNVNVHDRIGAGVHLTDSPHELVAAGATTAASESPFASSLDDVGYAHVGRDDSSAAEHAPVVLRMVDETPSEEAVAVVQREVPAAAAPAAEEEVVVVPVVDVSLGPETYVQEADLDLGAVEATKQLLLLARMANLAEAQRELEQRAKVTEALRDAYDWLEAAANATHAAAAGEQDQGQGIVQETQTSDGPTLYDLLDNYNQDQIDHNQQEQDEQDHPLDQAAADDAELTRQLLLWVVAHPGALSEQDPEAEPEAGEVADHHPAEEQVEGGQPGRAAQGVAEEPQPVQAGRQQDQLSHDEQEEPTPKSVVSWTQLNEDDKQDTLMPKLAARGLDGDDLPDLPVTESKLTRSEAQHTVPEVADGVELVPPVDEADEDDQDEARQVQQYRDLLSRRVPLMHHVLQLRRSQQEALQQEQRATAYLQLLDLHLWQRQQEAAARQRRRQHLRDLQRLQAYAAQLQQQDEQLYEQQVWWAQQAQQAPQAYAQQARADQQLYNQQTHPASAHPHPHPHQVLAAQQQCDCPHRVARGVHMPFQHPQHAAC